MTAVTRDGLLARQRRAVVVVAARFQASLAAGTYAWATEVRCEQPHRDGRRPVLAKLCATEQGMLFSSRIEWLSSDQLNRRPWDAESLLLRVDVAHWPDDEELAYGVESLTGPISCPLGGRDRGGSSAWRTRTSARSLTWPGLTTPARCGRDATTIPTPPGSGPAAS